MGCILWTPKESIKIIALINYYDNTKSRHSILVNGVECQNIYLPSKNWGGDVLEISLWHETPEENYVFTY